MRTAFTHLAYASPRSWATLLLVCASNNYLTHHCEAGKISRVFMFVAIDGAERAAKQSSLNAN